MDILLQQFLREHRTAICDLVEQRALTVSAYFTQLPPDARRQQCDYYTDVIMQAIVQGYIERPTSQHVVTELGAVGLRVDELLTQAAWIEAALEEYIQQELAHEADARENVLQRLRQAYSSFVTKLTAARLDQASYRAVRPEMF